MKKSIVIFIISFLGYINTAHSQAKYHVGIQKISIEPGDDFFSLPLQGYGDPVEGRFSLGWSRFQELAKSRTITGAGDYLFSLKKNGDLWHIKTSVKNPVWEFVGATDTVFRLAGSDPNSFKLIAGLNDRLYAITLNNKLQVYNLSHPSMNWETIGETENTVGFTAGNNKLYIVTSDGNLLEGEIKNNTIIWSLMGEVKQGVISIAAILDRIYILTDSQRIWEGKKKNGTVVWNEIAYLNGITYKTPVNQIAISNGNLYAVGFDNVLYKSFHHTNNDLSVNALVIKSEKTSLAIVGIDLCAMDYEFSQEIKKEIKSKTGITEGSIMLNFSHSHFSPVSKLWYAFGAFGVPDERYMQKIKESIVKAVIEAEKNMELCDLFYGRTKTYIGRNRSLQGEDAKINDPDLDIIKMVRSDGTLKTVLFFAGCHPVFTASELEFYSIGANYPAIARNMIEDKLKIDNSVFLQTTSADINPRIDDYTVLGTALAFDVLKRMDEPMQKISGGISFHYDSIVAPINVWSKEDIKKFRNENSNKSGDIEAEKNVRWANSMLNNYETVSKSSMPVYIQTFNIGNWKLIGLSREPVSEYGIAIKDLFPGKLVTVAGYNNDVSSYLPSPKHILAKTYEGSYSFYWYGAIALFPEGIMDLVMQKIKKINKIK
jgi:hypothetical protein